MRACRDFQYGNKNDICYFSPLAMWNLARLKLNPYLKLPLLPDTLCRRGGIKRYRDPSVCLPQPRLYARWRRGAAAYAIGTLAACSWPATRDVQTADPSADGVELPSAGAYRLAAPGAITCT